MHKAVKGGLAAVAVVLVVGAIGGAAFYQDEVGGFVRLQGWNTGPVTQATREFIQAAAAKDGERVAGMLATDAPTLQPVKKGNSVSAFMVGAYGGPKRITLKELCPTDSPQLKSPKLVFLEGGSVLVDAEYPGGHTVTLRWDRKDEGWKVIEVSQNTLR